MNDTQYTPASMAGETPMPEPVLPDELENIEACTKESKPVHHVPESARSFAANQLAIASGLLSDCPAEAEDWNLKNAVDCIRIALRALSKGGR